MENLETNEVTPTKKTKSVEYTWLEKEIMGRRNDLNFPALQSMFGLTETELQTILDKLPPIEDCNC